jgi:hypothetical protein
MDKMKTLQEIKNRLLELKFIKVDNNIYDNYNNELSVNIINEDEFIVNFNNEDCLLEEQRQWYDQNDLYELFSSISKEG